MIRLLGSFVNLFIERLPFFRQPYKGIIRGLLYQIRPPYQGKPHTPPVPG